MNHLILNDADSCNFIFAAPCLCQGRKNNQPPHEFVLCLEYSIHILVSLCVIFTVASELITVMQQLNFIATVYIRDVQFPLLIETNGNNQSRFIWGWKRFTFMG